MNPVIILGLFPPLFLIFAWAVLVLIRYCMPERKLPGAQHRIWVRQQMQAVHGPAPVGSQQIREDQRRLSRRMALQQRYTYSVAAGSGPRRAVEVWMDDLWSRRN